MRVVRSFAAYSLCVLLVLSVVLDEAEGRRKILRGRKTISRSYYKAPPVPGWAVILIVAGVILIVGGVLYVVMDRVVLGRAPPPRVPVTMSNY